jgi:hypothetical protein
VVRRVDESVVRERYRASIAGIGYDPFGAMADPRCAEDELSPPSCRQNFDLRLSLYALASDPERRVAGADVRVLASGNDESLSVRNTPGLDLPPEPMLGNIVGYGDGSLELQNAQRQAVISSFKRPSPLTPGATVQATLSCGMNKLFFAGCGALDATAEPISPFDDPVFNPLSVDVTFRVE